jgi:hypothetical protein
MREVAAANTVPGADDAVVVFARLSEERGFDQVSIFEVDEENRAVLIGILAAFKKIAHRTTPGRHLFMLIGGDADFMTANIEAGKLYYVAVMLADHAFTLQPVHAAEHEELGERLAHTGWVETTPDSMAWARDNAQDIEAKRFKYYGIWRRKPSFERLALFPDDGR